MHVSSKSKPEGITMMSSSGVSSKPERRMSLEITWLTAPQAAEYLQITLPALYALNARREINYYKAGKRRIRYSKADLDAFLGARIVPAAN